MGWSRRAAAAAIAASLLAGCVEAGRPDPPGAVPASPGPTPSVASPAPPPAQAPARVSPTDGPSLAVGGVSVDLCRRCVTLARRAGWDLGGRIRRALRRATPMLPGVASHVRVLLAPPDHPNAASGGAVRASGDIRLVLDLRGAPDDVREKLPLLLSHELHHVQRMTRGPGPGTTLIEDLVSEGLADAFALELYPRFPQGRWIPPVDSATLPVLWRRARRENHRPYSRPRFRRWFVDGNAELPHAGYAVGHAIVARYLARHPGVRPSDLTVVPADDILAGSGLPR